MSLLDTWKTCAVATVVSLLGAGVVTAQPNTTETPVRITIELREHGAPLGPRPSIVKWVERGIVRGLPKGSVRTVEAPETPNLRIVVSYGTDTYPEERTQQADGKVTTRPAIVLEHLSANIEGRPLKARVDTRDFFARWDRTAETLGRDIALVVKARLEAAAGSGRAETDVEDLIQRLDGRNSVERARSAAQLGRLGPAGAPATDALVRRLGDDATLRVVGPGIATTVGDEAAKALLNIGATTALMTFVRSDEDGTARARALRELARSTHPQLRDVVTAALDDRSREVRTEATWVAGRVLGRSAVPKLIEIVGRSQDRDTLTAAHANLKRLTSQDFGLNAGKWREWNASPRR